jgi:uncharacterized protein
MSDQNVALVAACYDAFNRGAWDEVEAAGDPAITLEEPAELPAPERPSGRDAVLRYLRSFETVWTDAVWETDELLDAGDKVLAEVRFRAIGRKSGVPVEMRWVHVWTVRQGRAYRIQAFLDRANALEAAGVAED